MLCSSSSFGGAFRNWEGGVVENRTSLLCSFGVTFSPWSWVSLLWLRLWKEIKQLFTMQLSFCEIILTFWPPKEHFLAGASGRWVLQICRHYGHCIPWCGPEINVVLMLFSRYVCRKHEKKWVQAVQRFGSWSRPSRKLFSKELMKAFFNIFTINLTGHGIVRVGCSVTKIPQTLYKILIWGILAALISLQEKMPQMCN